MFCNIAGEPAEYTDPAYTLAGEVASVNGK
jgi:hypothetical protein